MTAEISKSTDINNAMSLQLLLGQFLDAEKENIYENM